MSALIYRPNKKGRFAAALLAAAIVHLAAVGLANSYRDEPATLSGDWSGPPEIFVEPQDTNIDPQQDQSDPLSTPPAIDETYVEDTTPPPVRRQENRSTPLVRPRRDPAPRSTVNISMAKVLALSAPRPEYPYEARRQKITGDGVAVMSVDPGSGNVTGVTMAKSTGSDFLDNAAVAGFRRWRFKPGSVSTVTCPVTFTLSGASY
jgi:TonB family protein